MYNELHPLDGLELSLLHAMHAELSAETLQTHVGVVGDYLQPAETAAYRHVEARFSLSHWKKRRLYYIWYMGS